MTHHPHADPTADGKATTAGLKPLLLPSTFSPQLPPTPEAGALPQPGAPHHHPVRRSSSTWLRHTNPLQNCIHSHTSHSYGGSSSSLASSSSSSHHHLHQRQMSMDWSRSPSLSFDSEDSSASSSDSLYDASSATTSPSSVCSSTPKPFRAPPARSFSASAATRSSTPTTTNSNTPTPTPPASSVLRTSSLPHAISPTSANIITTQGEHTRANRIQRSSISYSKSSFQPLLLRSSSSSSSPQLPLLSHPNPSARHGYSPSLDHLLEVFHPPSRPLTSDLHSDCLLDKLLDELVQCAHELGLEDELAGIVQF